MSKPFDPPQYPKLWGGAHQLSERKVKGLHLTTPQVPFASSARVDGAIGYRKGDWDAVVREEELEPLRYLVAGNPNGTDQPSGVWGSATGTGYFRPYGRVIDYPPEAFADDNLIITSPTTGMFTVASINGGTEPYEWNLYVRFSTHRAARGFKLQYSDVLEFTYMFPGYGSSEAYGGFSAPATKIEPETGRISWRQMFVTASIEPIADPVTRYTPGGSPQEIIGDYYPICVRFNSDGGPELLAGLGFAGMRHGRPSVFSTAVDRLLMVTPVMRSRASYDASAGYISVASTPVPFITLSADMGDNWLAVASDAFITSAIPTEVLTQDSGNPTLQWDVPMREFCANFIVVPLTETSAWICAGGLFPVRTQQHGFIDTVTGTITALGALPSVSASNSTVKVCDRAVEAKGEFMLLMRDMEEDANVTVQITKDFITFETVDLPWLSSRVGEPSADGPDKIIMPIYTGKDYVLMASRDCGRTWRQQAVILANGGEPATPLPGESGQLSNFFYVETVSMKNGGLSTSFAPSWVMDRRVPPPETFPR